MLGFDLGKRFAGTTDRPTALVSWNERLASRFILGFVTAAGRIPDDISVVTYNNSRFAATSSMPMTTVGVPTGLYAEETVKLILEGTAAREAGADLLRQVMLPPEMIVRQSSGPVGTEDGKRKTRKSKEPKNRGTAERRTEKAERGTRTRRAGRRHG